MLFEVAQYKWTQTSFILHFKNSNKAKKGRELIKKLKRTNFKILCLKIEQFHKICCKLQKNITFKDNESIIKYRVSH